MKNIIYTVLIVLAGATQLNAQDCNQIKRAKIQNANEVEDCVLECANKILSTPLQNKTEDYFISQKFVLLWMEKTKYEFKLGEGFSTLTKGDNQLELSAVFFASLAKAAITEKKDFQIPALKLYAEYLKNDKNGIKLSSKQKKFLTDVEAGSFEKYID
jgi:hypothetical protein